MPGYYNDPEATAKAMRAGDGWFDTGRQCAPFAVCLLEGQVECSLFAHCPVLLCSMLSVKPCAACTATIRLLLLLLLRPPPGDLAMRAPAVPWSSMAGNIQLTGRAKVGCAWVCTALLASCHITAWQRPSARMHSTLCCKLSAMAHKR